jgi:hypothetical protein
MRKIAEGLRWFTASPLAGVATVVLWCGGLLGSMLYLGRLG